jgi:hypothetical protein
MAQDKLEHNLKMIEDAKEASDEKAKQLEQYNNLLKEKNEKLKERVKQ